ncbi:MAG: peptidylprolyl isomerase [Nitrospira sp.]
MMMHLSFMVMFFAVILMTTVPNMDASGEELPPGLYAVMETNLGDITIELFPKEAPKTVENFIGLAEGTKEWTDPKTRKKVKKPLYDNIIFHRVIPGFMIQGGDPMENGMGGPGYQFGDEFTSKLKFDRPGRLAMANSGPNTNGSQFFITEGATPHLNNKHTIFGQVFKGQDVVRKIARAPKDRRDRPNNDVTLKKVRIVRSK